jgi:RND family efflux transporter MFP subunit
VNLRLNQKRLSDARLQAPLDAVVLRRLIQPAEMVAPGHPALILGDLNPVRVRVGIPEAEIGKIATGQQATVRVPALGERTFAGTVELVAYAAEPSSRTFAVRILTANPRLDLRAGMVAEAEITTGMKQSALTLPGESIIRDPQGVTHVLVYFPEQRQVWTRRVKVGGVVGNEIEVTEGLSEQDEVVVAGQTRVRSGTVVTAVRGQQ